MNANQARQLSLPELIEAAGGQPDPQKSKGDERWFFSPFRNEKTASLHATVSRETGYWIWFDHGSGEGGNVIDFANRAVGREPGDRAIGEALRWLDRVTGQAPANISRASLKTGPSHSPGAPARPRFELVSVRPLRHYANVRYLHGRGLQKRIVYDYLREVTFKDTKTRKSLFGLGMENSAGGWEISTATERPFKTCIGPKSYSRFFDAPVARPFVHVFEGMFDYASYLQLFGLEAPLGVAYVLHSATLAGRVAEVVAQETGSPVVLLWLDNDDTGAAASRTLMDALEPTSWKVGTMNHVYEGYKDLNAWLQATPPGARPPLMDLSPSTQFYGDTTWASLHEQARRHAPSSSPGASDDEPPRYTQY
ncbi:MAG: toprim domain-containing protein [Bacteroidota bacterium]